MYLVAVAGDINEPDGRLLARVVVAARQGHPVPVAAPTTAGKLPTLLLSSRITQKPDRVALGLCDTPGLERAGRRQRVGKPVPGGPHPTSRPTTRS